MRVIYPSPGSTFQVHKKQISRQIFTPLFFSILLFILLGILAASGTFNNPANGTRWAGIAIIGMIFPLLFAGLAFLIITILLCLMLAKLLNIVPTYSLILRSYFYQAAFFIRKWSDRAVEPVLKPKILWAGIQRLFSELIHIR